MYEEFKKDEVGIVFAGDEARIVLDLKSFKGLKNIFRWTFECLKGLKGVKDLKGL